MEINQSKSNYYYCYWDPKIVNLNLNILFGIPRKGFQQSKYYSHLFGLLRQRKAFSGVRNVTDVLFPWLLTYMYNFSPLIVTLPGPCLPHVYYCPIHCPCTGHEVRIMMDTCKNNFYTNWIIINRAVNPPAGWRGREIGIIIQLLYCVDGSDGIGEYILCNNHASTRIHLILIEVKKQGSSKGNIF